MKTAFLFPGQGSQAVGMGHAFALEYPTARAVFEEADDALGFALSQLCFEGPEEELQLTANAQPAILATSVAIQRVVAERGVVPDLVAGHSLGEYSALVAASVLELGDALRMVRRRGEAMQAAVPVGVGAMAAIIGLERGELELVVAESAGDEVCEIANDNAPGQIVIAGETAAVARASERALAAGAKRAIELPVSAPFHCSLMAPAREVMAPLLAETTFRDPEVPVITNVDARAVTTGDAARDALVRQIDGAVRWVDSIRCAEELGAEAWVEVGPGKVLSGMVKRILKGVRPTSITDPQSLPAQS